MIRTRRTALFAAVLIAATTLAAGMARAEAPKPKGLGDPGALTDLRLEPSLEAKGVTIRGRNARQQLFATGVYSSGQLRDQTRKVEYNVEPAGVLKIDATGLAMPLADGTATVTAKEASGMTASLTVTVDGMTNDKPINFQNQIVPIFTKLGCNGGGCHGKSSGQNGFRLSLLGFYPDEDHEFLVKEGRGRRLFPSAAGESLLLAKATGRSPHR